jgi:hypothetical protein
MFSVTLVRGAEPPRGDRRLIVRLSKFVAALACFALVGCATEARYTLYISDAAVMPAGPGSRVSLDHLPMYTPIISRSRAFGTVIPQGWCYYITDVYYSAKPIETGGSGEHPRQQPPI